MCQHSDTSKEKGKLQANIQRMTAFRWTLITQNSGLWSYRQREENFKNMDSKDILKFFDRVWVCIRGRTERSIEERSSSCSIIPDSDTHTYTGKRMWGKEVVERPLGSWLLQRDFLEQTDHAHLGCTLALTPPQPKATFLSTTSYRICRSLW